MSSSEKRTKVLNPFAALVEMEKGTLASKQTSASVSGSASAVAPEDLKKARERVRELELRTFDLENEIVALRAEKDAADAAVAKKNAFVESLTDAFDLLKDQVESVAKRTTEAEQVLGEVKSDIVSVAQKLKQFGDTAKKSLGDKPAESDDEEQSHPGARFRVESDDESRSRAGDRDRDHVDETPDYDYQDHDDDDDDDDDDDEDAPRPAAAAAAVATTTTATTATATTATKKSTTSTTTAGAKAGDEIASSRFPQVLQKHMNKVGDRAIVELFFLPPNASGVRLPHPTDDVKRVIQREDATKYQKAAAAAIARLLKGVKQNKITGKWRLEKWSVKEKVRTSHCYLCLLNINKGDTYCATSQGNPVHIPCFYVLGHVSPLNGYIHFSMETSSPSSSKVRGAAAPSGDE